MNLKKGDVVKRKIKVGDVVEWTHKACERDPFIASGEVLSIQTIGVRGGGQGYDKPAASIRVYDHPYWEYVNRSKTTINIDKLSIVN